MKLPGPKFEYPSRRLRRRRVYFLGGILLVLLYAGLWWFPPNLSTNPFRHPRSYGTFEYLDYRQYPQYPSNPSPPDQFLVNWLAFAVNIALTIAPTGILIYIGRQQLQPRRSKWFCDECGYSLKGSRARTCPECGAKTPD